MEEDSSDFKILTDKPRGKKPLGRPSRGWEDNIYSVQDKDCSRTLVNAALKPCLHEP